MEKNLNNKNILQNHAVRIIKGFNADEITKGRSRKHSEFQTVRAKKILYLG
jgi:hypothetical protein